MCLEEAGSTGTNNLLQTTYTQNENKECPCIPEVYRLLVPCTVCMHFTLFTIYNISTIFISFIFDFCYHACATHTQGCIQDLEIGGGGGGGGIIGGNATYVWGGGIIQ